MANTVRRYEREMANTVRRYELSLGFSGAFYFSTYFAI